MAQIALFNVTNDSQYLPQRRDMFNDSRWIEAKRLLAQALKLTSKEAARYSSRFLQDRMVGGRLSGTIWRLLQRNNMFGQRRRT